MRRRGRHVGRPRLVLECLGQPEVEDLDLVLRRNLDVRRVEVAVHDAALVRFLERQRHLQCDTQRLFRGQPPAGETFGEGFPLNHLHHDQLRAVDLFDLVDAGDVRMAECGQQFGLAHEACTPLLVGRQLRREHLDRDLAVQGRIDGFPDHTHPAFADLLDDAVVQQLASRFDQHVDLPASENSSSSKGEPCFLGFLKRSRAGHLTHPALSDLLDDTVVQ